MLKFRKAFNSKIIVLVVFGIILFPDIAVGYRPPPTHLRNPLATNSNEGRKRLIEALSEVTYHDYVNGYIAPLAESQYKGFLRRAGLEDGPESLGLFYDSLEKYKGIAVMEIDGLYKNTRILEHIGLGRVYGKPIIYIDSSLERKEDLDVDERREILWHASDEITGWTKERESLGLDGSEWHLMRDRILEDYREFQAVADRIHREAHDIDNILRDYEAKHKTDLLDVIAMMPFEEGDVVIAARADDLRNDIERLLDEAEQLLGEDPDLSLLEGRIHTLLTNAHGKGLSLEAEEEGAFQRYSGRLSRLMREMNRQRHEKGGSPLGLLSFMVQNEYYENNPISRGVLKRARGFEDTTIYYETASLERVDLLKSIPDPKDHRKRLYFLTKRLTQEQVKAIGEAVPELGKKTITDLPVDEIARIAQRAQQVIGISKEAINLNKLEETPVFFLEEHVRANVDGFIQAVAELNKRNNTVVVIIDSEEKRKDFENFRIDRGLLDLKFFIASREELGITGFDFEQATVSIIDIPNLSCIPVLPDSPQDLIMAAEAVTKG